MKICFVGKKGTVTKLGPGMIADRIREELNECLRNLNKRKISVTNQPPS